VPACTGSTPAKPLVSIAKDSIIAEDQPAAFPRPPDFRSTRAEPTRPLASPPPA
jgi:hypothetical protein